MTPSMLYDGLLSIQSKAGIDLNGGGDRDVKPALDLIESFERAAMARALRWAAKDAGADDPAWLERLAVEIENGGSISE